MAKRRKAYRYSKPKLRRRSARTTDAKSKSLQSSFRKYTSTTLTLADAREIIKNPPACVYCGKDIPWNLLSYDHVIPQSRSGPATADNLVLVHNSCNRIKGNLTGEEFTALLQFLDNWPIMKVSVLDRLRIAGALYGRRKR